jgi:hypothetical protein
MLPSVLSCPFYGVPPSSAVVAAFPGGIGHYNRVLLTRYKTDPSTPMCARASAGPAGGHGGGGSAARASGRAGGDAGACRLAGLAAAVLIRNGLLTIFEWAEMIDTCPRLEDQMIRRNLLLSPLLAVAGTLGKSLTAEASDGWPDNMRLVGLKHYRGDAWSFTDTYPGKTKLGAITVQYGTLVDALWLHWDNGRDGGRDGGYGGNQKTIVSFASDEYLTGFVISRGFHQHSPPEVLKSIIFRTNKRLTERYGAAGDPETTLDAPNGYQIMGFHGWVGNGHGHMLELGAISVPI